MNEHLKERIARALEHLPDERGYQILDFVEFLDSKYAERAAPDNVFTRMTDKAEDLLRAGKVPFNAIGGTVSFFDGASKVVRGLSSAAAAVVDEAARTAQNLTTPSKPADATLAKSDDPPAPPTTPPEHHS
ncbi:MAG TPA: hypothetical protein VGM77_01635 [Gemmatimonadales bacterium]|jgi:hypothetical protein